jgi:hypothetical protein
MEMISWRVNGVVWVMMYPWVVVWRIVLILNQENKIKHRGRDIDLYLLKKFKFPAVVMKKNILISN